MGAWLAGGLTGGIPAFPKYRCGECVRTGSLVPMSKQAELQIIADPIGGPAVDERGAAGQDPEHLRGAAGLVQVAAGDAIQRRAQVGGSLRASTRPTFLRCTYV